MIPSLTVREVRDALAPRGDAGQGASSTVHLGRIFHETFAGLVGSDPALNRTAALAGIDSRPETRRNALTRHAYERIVGPRLCRDKTLLQGRTEPLPAFWSAVVALCEWLATLPETSAPAATEVPLSRTLTDPSWTGPVRLTGIADAVLEASPGRWCVVELKLGRSVPEADLAQALLYSLMLSNAGRPPGALALVRFAPDRSERVFRAEEVEPARGALFELIGRLAGVHQGGKVKPASTTDVSETPADLGALGQKLVKAFWEYGVNLGLDGPPVMGPTFVRYNVALGTGVTLKSAQNRAREIQVRLGLTAAPRIGVERSRVVVDVERPDRQRLDFATIRGQFLESVERNRSTALLPVGVGINGELVVADLSKPEHAHMLVAGTTGSGKSEWLRSAVAGLLLANTPETLRLVVIDPKRNAFGWLRHSPFLLREPIHPSDKGESVTDVLDQLIDEMEQRYKAMQASGSDDIAQHADKTGVILPRIVCVCDEYADLIGGTRNRREAIEERIRRLGAKARASGIHLILATQQPSRRMIAGALDTNIPARVGLLTQRSTESNMLLGQSGAENLLGRGDLLFKDIGEPIRLQAPLLEDDLREELATHPGRADRP